MRTGKIHLTNFFSNLLHCNIAQHIKRHLLTLKYERQHKFEAAMKEYPVQQDLTRHVRSDIARVARLSEKSGKFLKFEHFSDFLLTF